MLQASLRELFPAPAGRDSEEMVSFVAGAQKWAEQQVLSQRPRYREDGEKAFRKARSTLYNDVGFSDLRQAEILEGFGKVLPQTLAEALIEVARADVSQAFLAAQELAVAAALKEAGTAEHQKLLESILGADAANTAAVLLPAAASKNSTPLFRGRGLEARASDEGEALVLEGKNLRPMGDALDAALYVIPCGTKKKNTPVVVFARGKSHGIKKRKIGKSTGLSPCRFATVELNRCRVKKSHVVGDGAFLDALFVWLNLLLGAATLGGTKNALEILDEWAESRTIKGGQLLKNNPLCASVLADVADAVATANLLLLNLAALSEHRETDFEKERRFVYAQLIGRQVQTRCLHALNRGMELMGSAGYAKEWHFEKHWRDVKTIGALLAGVAAEVPMQMDVARFVFGSDV